MSSAADLLRVWGNENAAGGVIVARVQGLAELQQALAGVVPRLRDKVLLAALKRGARRVQAGARAKTPRLAADHPSVALGYRKPGLLRRKISVRPSKLEKRAGNVGVFVNVRPAPGAKYQTVKRVGILGSSQRMLVRASKRGARSPDDPYYWRWVNWSHRTRGGGSTVPGVEFMEAGAAKLPEARDMIFEDVIAVVGKMNQRKVRA